MSRNKISWKRDQSKMDKMRNLSRVLIKSMRWLQWRSRKGILIMNKKERILSDSTRWNSRQRCAEIGNLLASAISKTIVLLLMDNMNLWKSNTSLKISKLNLAINSIKLGSVLMAPGANSFIPSMIFLILTYQNIPEF